MAIATKEAVFALPEVKLGIIPAVISPYVVAAIGQKQARRYFLTGERFSPGEAKRIGLVKVVPVGQLRQAAQNILKYFRRNGPMAMATAKDLIFTVASHPLDETLAFETAKHVAQAKISDEGKEGVSAYLKKRTPSWIAA